MQHQGQEALTRFAATRAALCGCVVFAVLVAGCSTAKPKPADLRYLLQHRYGLTSEEAGCVTNGVFRAFSSADLKRIRGVDQTTKLPAPLQTRLADVLRDLTAKCGPPAPPASTGSSTVPS